MKTHLFFILFFLISVVTNSTTTEYYVSSFGKDSNPCTNKTHPCKTLSHILNEIIPEEGNITITVLKNSSTLIIDSVISHTHKTGYLHLLGEPNYILDESEEEKLKLIRPKIDLHNNKHDHETNIVLLGSDILVSGLEFSGHSLSYFPDYKSVFSFWDYHPLLSSSTSVSSLGYSKVENCKFHNFNYDSPRQNNQLLTSTVVENTVFENLKLPGLPIFLATPELRNSSFVNISSLQINEFEHLPMDTVIDSCYFENIDGPVCDTQNSHTSFRFYVRNCEFTRNSGRVLYINNGESKETFIENNIFHGNTVIMDNNPLVSIEEVINTPTYITNCHFYDNYFGTQDLINILSPNCVIKDSYFRDNIGYFSGNSENSKIPAVVGVIGESKLEFRNTKIERNLHMVGLRLVFHAGYKLPTSLLFNSWVRNNSIYYDYPFTAGVFCEKGNVPIEVDETSGIENNNYIFFKNKNNDEKQESINSNILCPRNNPSGKYLCHDETGKFFPRYCGKDDEFYVDNKIGRDDGNCSSKERRCKSIDYTYKKGSSESFNFKVKLYPNPSTKYEITEGWADFNGTLESATSSSSSSTLEKEENPIVFFNDFNFFAGSVDSINFDGIKSSKLFTNYLSNSVFQNSNDVELSITSDLKGCLIHKNQDVLITNFENIENSRFLENTISIGTFLIFISSSSGSGSNKIYGSIFTKNQGSLISSSSSSSSIIGVLENCDFLNNNGRVILIDGENTRVVLQNTKILDNFCDEDLPFVCGIQCKNSPTLEIHNNSRIENNKDKSYLANLYCSGNSKNHKKSEECKINWDLSKNDVKCVDYPDDSKKNKDKLVLILSVSIGSCLLLSCLCCLASIVGLIFVVGMVLVCCVCCNSSMLVGFKSVVSGKKGTYQRIN